jgi:hypothetical protein
VSLETVLARCIVQWRDEGTPLLAPRSESEIHEVWARFNQPVSADVLRLYTLVGGFEDSTMDDEFSWTLWPWDKLVEDNASWRGEGIRFCDHSISIDTWEFRFVDERHSSIWSIENHEMTAPSLESYLETYLSDPFRLLWRWE